LNIVASDNDIKQYAIDNFIDIDIAPSGLFLYGSEDYARLGDLHYPFMHAFCYNKSVTNEEVRYTVAIEISAWREVDSNDEFVHTVSGSVTSEGLHGKIDTLVTMLVTLLREDIATYGVAGQRGFEIMRVDETTLPPSGANDIRCLIDLDIKIDKCLTRS